MNEKNMKITNNAKSYLEHKVKFNTLKRQTENKYYRIIENSGGRMYMQYKMYQIIQY